MAKKKRKAAKDEKTPKAAKEKAKVKPVGDDDEEVVAGAEPADAPETPEETTSLVTVVHTRNMKEAKTMKAVLEAAEIPAFIGQEDVDPDGPRETEAHGGVPILVPEELAGEAAELLAEAAMRESNDEEDEADEDWEADDGDEDEDLLDDGDIDDIKDADVEYDNDLDDDDDDDDEEF